MADVVFKLNLRTEEAKQEFHDAALTAVTEVFELDIKAAAMDASPVATGTNKRSIDTEVEEVAGGVKAELFTQSGYGGYLETGTYKMEARPYLGPAFFEGIDTIPDKIKEKIDGQ